MRTFFYYTVAAIFGLGFFSHTALASTILKTIDSTGALVKSISLTDSRFANGAEISAGDIDGDGQIEYVAAPEGSAARIFVFVRNGDLKKSFPVLDGKFIGGVNVTVSDLNADGVAEIIIGAKAGGGPHVEVYDGEGVKESSFLAYDHSFRGGVDVAVGDINADGIPEIVTASGYESPGHIRAFTSTGHPLNVSFFPFGEKADAGASLAVGDVDSINRGDEIISVPLGAASPTIVVSNNRGTELANFSAFPAAINRGLNVTTVKFGTSSQYQIAVAPRNASPHTRIFNGDGVAQQSFFSFSKKFRGDTSFFGTGDGTLVVVAQPQKLEGRRDLVRYIDINLTKQKLSVFRLGRKLGEYRVSTGKWSMPTPTGTFTTHNKIRTAYSRRYHLYMDYWMAITPNGAYGIHSLPFWVLKDGSRLYEGTNHLGTPVSHGCVRLHPTAAKTVFDWAPIGTTVIIHT